MRDVNSQIRVIHLFDFLLSSPRLHKGFFPVLKVFAFSTIKIPIMTLSALELSCWLAETLNYLDQSGEVGGGRYNHGHSVGMEKKSLRRQHAFRGKAGTPQKLTTSRSVREGYTKKIYRLKFFQDYKARSQIASVRSPALIKSVRGKERKSTSATLNGKVIFLDREERSSCKVSAPEMEGAILGVPCLTRLTKYSSLI